LQLADRAVPIRRGRRRPAERRWLLIPREEIEIIDDWYTVGLKGTGSKTIVVNDVFVPGAETVLNKDIEEARRLGAGSTPTPCNSAISSATSPPPWPRRQSALRAGSCAPTKSGSARNPARSTMAFF